MYYALGGTLIELDLYTLIRMTYKLVRKAGVKTLEYYHTIL